MFISKNNYYLYIENTQTLNLSLLKKRNKFIIIYRTNGKIENIQRLKSFKRECSRRAIKFYVANNLVTAIKCKADGLYISSHNKKYYHGEFLNKTLKIIGSAHNLREIQQKKVQRCKNIVFSRLFKTNYQNKLDYMGIVKFNLRKLSFNTELIPLGGIRHKNLNSLKLVKSDSFALLSEVKKKPAIIHRLF